MNEDPVRSIIDEVLSSLPSSLSQAQTMLSEHLELTLRRAVIKADLVPRDEFDAQCAVLLRTREKLETLELKLSALENAKKL